MSLLTPVKVPVEVYRWDDVGAPVLDKTAGCMMNIFKSCLVTGYGTKEPAGWTMPFEDTAAGIKVLRPTINPHVDFFLRLSADNGSKIETHVYTDMTDANTGQLRLGMPQPYKYATLAQTTNKWVLVASPTGFWFFVQTTYDQTLTKAGMWFFVGELSVSESDSAVALHYSGGSSNSDFRGWFGNKGDGENFINMRVFYNNAVKITEPVAWSDGANVRSAFSKNDFINAYIDVGGKVAPFTGVIVPLGGHTRDNFEVFTATTDQGTQSVMSIGSSTSNLGGGGRAIKLDFW